MFIDPDPTRPLDTLPKSASDSFDNYANFQLRIWGGPGWGRNLSPYLTYGKYKERE
jgi:hypothetical protein